MLGITYRSNPFSTVQTFFNLNAFFSIIYSVLYAASTSENANQQAFECLKVVLLKEQIRKHYPYRYKPHE